MAYGRITSVFDVLRKTWKDEKVESEVLNSLDQDHQEALREASS
jgi:hypothetical protein